MIEQKKDPAQSSFVKDLIKQMKNDDPSVDYSSILAFSYEYAEQTPGFGPGRVGFRQPKNRKDEHIPPEWVATLLAIYTRQKESLDDEAATSSVKEASLQDVKDFLTVCDLAWSILDYPLYSFGGGSAQAWVPARQELFQDKHGGISVAARVVDKMGSNMLTFSSARVVFKTDNGLIGLGPDYMSEGDEVWDLVGGEVPFLLSPETSDSDHGDRRRYRLVGECYVHGIMSGELWEDETKQSATRSLRGKDLKFETIQIV
ncbi:Heterokaryon incompatibility protein or allele [Lasiodiplodia theobromae]|uniref:Heterokaryon incompatibility protein or allele n=1 Tax=Lasiodiplodia theobromae TaxID=45133 RepID=UPI0015C31D9B|nr:Heterokaryon incompatibility protein or allele [Lasiodiplodia theobromae]KAF4537173.1 Heterokaryon incompatibility protein or allele [Lasiodiplodia theobromae]